MQRQPEEDYPHSVLLKGCVLFVCDSVFYIVPIDYVSK